MENKLKVVLIFLFLLISSFALAPLEGPTFLTGFAATDTEIQYPPVPGAPAPTATTTFPEYVKYLFNFAIIIVGLIVLAVLIWAGILYLTSTGDPNKISEAKSKAVAAFLGLLILLSSYLILTNINPQLTGLTLEPVPPLSGIYLISGDTPPKKTFFADSKASTSFTNASSVEFITATSSLTAVYLYDGENFTGTREVVTASSTLVILSGAEIKSVYFLWNRPGVYLYDLINFQLSNSTPYPVHTSGLISNLGSSNYNFDNKARSLKFNGLGKKYGTLLFTKIDYRGQCAYAQDLPLAPPVADLSVFQINYFQTPIGLDTLSSLLVFNVSDTVPGDVTFYPKENCKEDDGKKTWTGGSWKSLGLEGNFTNSIIPIDKNILSFQINGNFAVALNTEPLLNGRCQLFFKPGSNDPCIANLNYTDVYDPIDPSGDKVRSLIIIPLSF